LVSCKNEQKLNKEPQVEIFQNKKQTNRFFPEDITKIFDAHGGYALWNKQKTLGFTVVKSGNSEVHMADLKNRKTIIKATKFNLGFDGQDVWVNRDGIFPAENARFYHNLYFYFYAMPFILGDHGIHYEKINDLYAEGLHYPGYKISYDANIGDSPDDNYFIYTHPETGMMEWLGYTVTFGEGIPSSDIHYIRYTDWIFINGLKLPKTLQWYDTQENLPNQPTNKVRFENSFVSELQAPANSFTKPENAIIGI
jgi:hypothetical protein